MSLFKTKAIILKKKNFRENDRIFLTFTQKEGKLELLAKGSRKQKSKLAGLLEPFSLAEIMYARGRGFEQITSVKILKSYKNIRNNFLLITWLGLVVEIIERHIKPKYREREVFELLRNLLDILERGREKEDLKKIILIFASLFKLFKILGFRPQLYFCLHCLRKIKPKGSRFSLSLGGLLCPACQKLDSHSFQIQDSTIKILRLFLAENFIKIKKLKLTEKDLEEIKEVAFAYFPYILESELKTIDFIRKTI